VAQLFNDALDKTFEEIARRKEHTNGTKKHRTNATTTTTTVPTDEPQETENDQEQDDMEDNFGHLFDKIALREYGSSVVDSALWMWYQN
jgi:hypothetical protein